MWQGSTVIGFAGILCLPLAQKQSSGGEMPWLASLDHVPRPCDIVEWQTVPSESHGVGRAAPQKEGVQNQQNKKLHLLGLNFLTYKIAWNHP